MTKEEFVQLVRSSQDGDQEAMSRLMEEYPAVVQYQCRKILGHKEMLETLCSEILPGSSKSLASFTGAGGSILLAESDDGQPLQKRAGAQLIGTAVRGRGMETNLLRAAGGPGRTGRPDRGDR